ncbi:FAD-binding protein [Endothiovibrio diazotrophicus]
MSYSGWGRYPRLEGELRAPATTTAVARELAAEGGERIARGLGRSYGDSALAPRLVSSRRLDQILAFDEQSGRLRAAAGLSLADLLALLAPRGWFPPVTPGTKFVTLGGAVASDVHGKNHHLDGSFCDHVEELRLMLADGEAVTCSRDENPQLFHATCGGMGLTGVILDVTFRLRPLPGPRIAETTLKAAHLEEALALFDRYASTTYSVAWIDCLARGARLGRSLIMLGEHAAGGEHRRREPRPLSVPVDAPTMLLNRWSIAAFNTLYYGRIRTPRLEREVHYDGFFYPLDGIHHWNRLYGRRGFVQYQFVLPRDGGAEGMKSILQAISASRRGSFLAVLKAFGRGNDNLLSFPREGYTLALDFKLDDGLFKLLDELDARVLDYGGRLYLAKDARMSEATFKKSYPNWEALAELRARTGADRLIHSHQSRRLGL